MDEKILQWFPGHMRKAQRLIEENLPLVDVVIELLDARIPSSSQNPMLREIIGDKPRLIVLGKADLAAKNFTAAWLEHFREKNLPAVAVDAVKGSGLKQLIALAKSLAESKTHKLTKHGVKPRSARVMIVGIPNVGKSSLINRLAGAAHVKIENRPGVTRAKQWIKIADGLDLLDMPGILQPKFDDAEVTLKLAWTYAISDEIHDLELMTCKLLETLAEKFPAGLIERYKLSAPLESDGHVLLNQIGLKRGCIRKGGILDDDKAIRLVLSDFRDGKLGRVTLDEL
ncbi:MAG: ribosome biogenesis GTPase YlqF [Selenomonadaceae bacterium]|nr:ribosome biogenesis GTPase YlqF [Selenomonadaceae bacterium]